MGDSPERVPSIEELRSLAQGEKLAGDRRLWYRTFRWLSIRLTWVLLHSRITPNQVTVASLIIAAAGLVLIAISAWAAVADYLLLLVYHLLDRVDGEIARFRRIFSLHGIYLDNAGHYVTSAGIFLATTYRLAGAASRPQSLWLIGSIAALAAALYRVEKHAPFHLFSQYVVAQPELVAGMHTSASALTREATRADRSEGSPISAIGRLRDLVLSLTSFPAIVTLFLFGSVAEIIAGESTAIVLLVIVSLLQISAYISLEAINLSANLATETLRLAEAQPGSIRQDGSDRR